MQFTKALRFLFLLSLALGVFGGEIGESFHLTDDVSNDFVQVSASQIHKSGEIASARLISHLSLEVAEELVPCLAIIPFATPAIPSSGADLLRLVSIQRK